MKEVKCYEQHQQLIQPTKADQLLQDTDPVDDPCQTRNVCGKSNSSIGGSEDILF